MLHISLYLDTPSMTNKLSQAACIPYNIIAWRHIVAFLQHRSYLRLKAHGCVVKKQKHIQYSLITLHKASMGNCHIWNGQVADLVAPIFQKQTFRGNPTDSLCSYIVLASYVVFPLFFHYFFQILGPCRAGAGQNPELEKDKTSGQDPQSRLAQNLFFNSFNSFQSRQLFYLIAACCSIGTSLPSFFLIVLCKGSLHCCSGTIFGFRFSMILLPPSSSFAKSFMTSSQRPQIRRLAACSRDAAGILEVWGWKEDTGNFLDKVK